MPTVNQLIRGARRRPSRRGKLRGLAGAPQRRGVVRRVMVLDPKKPNSAERKAARVMLTSGIEVTAYIPGDYTAGNVQEHSMVLVRGGGPPDLVGVNYTIVPGAKAGSVAGPPGPYFEGSRVPRKKSRSRYGIKKTGAKKA